MAASQPKEEHDLQGLFRWTSEKDLDKLLKDGHDPQTAILAYPPSWSPMTILYLLLLYPTALLTLACVVIGYVPVKLPPQVQVIMRWKWAVVFLLNLLLFFFLILQLAMGFSLEDSVKKAQLARQNSMSKMQEEAKEPPLPQLQLTATISDAVSHVHTTYWLEIVVLLQILVVFTTLLMFWLNQRETFNKPPPELNLRW